MSTTGVAGHQRSGHLRRAGAPLLLGLVASLAAAGGWLIASGFTPAEETLPEPSPFVVIPDTGSPVPSEPGMAANQLRIPSIGLDRADLLPGGIIDDQLQLPSDPSKLTVYTDGAPACATQGTTLLAGHVINQGVHGALWPLHQIRPGAVAYLTCPDGTMTAWQVSQVQVVPKDSLPGDVYDADGRRRLVVVTCGGPVMRNGHYRDNVIVSFEPSGM